jgi:hypothetical protein
MHSLSPKIEEIMEFQIRLSVKQNLKKNSSENLCLISSVWILETIASSSQNFLYIYICVEHVMRIKYVLGERTN